VRKVSKGSISGTFIGCKDVYRLDTYCPAMTPNETSIRPFLDWKILFVFHQPLGNHLGNHLSDKGLQANNTSLSARFKCQAFVVVKAVR